MTLGLKKEFSPLLLADGSLFTGGNTASADPITYNTPAARATADITFSTSPNLNLMPIPSGTPVTTLRENSFFLGPQSTLSSVNPFISGNAQTVLEDNFLTYLGTGASVQFSSMGNGPQVKLYAGDSIKDGKNSVSSAESLPTGYGYGGFEGIVQAGQTAEVEVSMLLSVGDNVIGSPLDTYARAFGAYSFRFGNNNVFEGLELNSQAGNSAVSQTINFIFSNDSTRDLNLTFGFTSAAMAKVDNSNFMPSTNLNPTVTVSPRRDIDIHVSSVPEPGTGLAIAFGLAVLAAWTHWQRSRNSDLASASAPAPR